MNEQRRNLRILIEYHFNLGELRTLCSDLNVDYDNIPSEDNTKQLKIEGLIDYLIRRNLLEELRKLLKLERPNVNWDQLDWSGLLQGYKDSYNIQPDFSKQKSQLQVSTILGLASELSEWKIVHQTVQRLLLSLLPIEKKLNTLERILDIIEQESGTHWLLAEALVKEMDEYWHIHCKRKADAIKEKFSNFVIIDHLRITELVLILSNTYDQNIYLAFYNLQFNEPKSFRFLKIAYIELTDTLVSLLELSDVFIIQYAKEIESRFT